MTRAHWIRPNDMSRKPHRFIYFDTEARQDEHGVQRWRLAVAACDYRLRNGIVPGPYTRFETPAALWKWVEANAVLRGRTIVIAHNVGYDLRIGDAFRQLNRLGWRLDRIRLDATQAQARWRKGDRTIVAIDSMSWCPVALEQIGEDLGLAKHPLPHFDDPDAAWAERCLRDVEILRAFWHRVLDWIDAQDQGSWQTSGAGQATTCWRHRFLTHRVLVDQAPEKVAIERAGAWAGRVEACQPGTHQRVEEWDFETAYLRILEHCDLPLRGGWVPPQRWPTLEQACRPGGPLVLARVVVDTPARCVPSHDEDGLIAYRVGRFETTLWTPELRLLAEHGATVEWQDVWAYDSAPALKAWAAWCRGQLDSDDPLVGRMAKHMSRAIVGRFGVRYSAWQDAGDLPDDEPDVRLISCDDGRLLQLGRQVLEETDLLDGENAAVQVWSYVQSVCRAWVWKMMRTAGREHTLYVDTDGGFFDAYGGVLLGRSGPPGCRLKRMWRKLEVIKARQYILDGEILRAAGIPRRARRTGERTFVATVFPQLTTTLKSGSPDTVAVREREYTLR